MLRWSVSPRSRRKRSSASVLSATQRPLDEVARFLGGGEVGRSTLAVATVPSWTCHAQDAGAARRGAGGGQGRWARSRSPQRPPRGTGAPLLGRRSSRAIWSWAGAIARPSSSFNSGCWPSVWPPQSTTCPEILATAPRRHRARQDWSRRPRQGGPLRGLDAPPPRRWASTWAALYLVNQEEAPPSVASVQAAHRPRRPSRGAPQPRRGLPQVPRRPGSRAPPSPRALWRGASGESLPAQPAGRSRPSRSCRWWRRTTGEWTSCTPPTAGRANAEQSAHLEKRARPPLGLYPADRLRRSGPRVTGSPDRDSPRARRARGRPCSPCVTIPTAGFRGLPRRGRVRAPAPRWRADDEMVYETRIGENFMLARRLGVDYNNHYRCWSRPRPEAGQEALRHGDAGGATSSSARPTAAGARAARAGPATSPSSGLPPHALDALAAQNWSLTLEDSRRRGRGARTSAPWWSSAAGMSSAGAPPVMILSPYAAACTPPGRWPSSRSRWRRRPRGRDLWSDDGKIVRFP